MHPLLARYLNIDVAVDTLHREDAGQVLKSDERFFAAVARSAPDRRAALVGARGQKHPGPEVQESLVFLAAHAAAAALEKDPALGPRVKQARDALLKEGATPAEADQLIATLVLEEAFGYDEGADEFDQTFFEETLESVPALAAATRERVDQLYQAFARTASEDWRIAHQLAAQTLFEAAWNEGPEPFNPEHVQLALDQMVLKLSAPEQARAPVAMKRFLGFLLKAELVGPLRLARLMKVVDHVAAAGVGPLN